MVVSPPLLLQDVGWQKLPVPERDIVYYWLRDGTDAMNKPGDWRLATEKYGTENISSFILEQQLEFDRPFMGRGATDRL